MTYRVDHDVPMPPEAIGTEESKYPCVLLRVGDMIGHSGDVVVEVKRKRKRVLYLTQRASCT
jgi:hypothetical protein